MRNILKEKLARGEKPLGTFVGTGSAAVVECLGCAGLDFAILDNEHSPIEAETTARLVCAAERRNITPLARVREISRPAILKLLDVGVQGIIIPDVHSAAEVKRVVDYAKYAPVGQRGFCPSRKDGWGTDTPAGVLETMAHFNGETLVIPQCETTEALADIENIAAMEGVDGIFIGPFDLSISMGLPGAFEEQRFKAALTRIQQACRQAGKPCLIFAGDGAAARCTAGPGLRRRGHRTGCHDADHRCTGAVGRLPRIKKKRGRRPVGRRPLHITYPSFFPAALPSCCRSTDIRGCSGTPEWSGS